MTSKNADLEIPAVSEACSSKTTKLRNELLALRAKQDHSNESTPESTYPIKDHRSSARYDLSNAAVCYYVLPSGEVEIQSAIPAVLVDGSIGGMQLWVDSVVPAVGRELLVGIEHAGNELAWFGTRVVEGKRVVEGTRVVESTRAIKGTQKDIGHSELHLAFAGSTYDLFQQNIIAPVLDRQDMKYRLPTSDAALKSLVAVGAAHRLSLDFVSVCPACQGIPTVRSGCGMCLSSHTETKKMIHHYACANVDFVENFEFETNGRTEIFCKKCRCRNMIVGSDYEYLDGPNDCQDCGQSNLELTKIGHCLSCSNRFPLETAHNLELIGYRVKRLDILDIIHTA